jgi:hypothetical protein
MKMPDKTVQDDNHDKNWGKKTREEEDIQMYGIW